MTGLRATVVCPKMPFDNGSEWTAVEGCHFEEYSMAVQLETTVKGTRNLDNGGSKWIIINIKAPSIYLKLCSSGKLEFQIFCTSNLLDKKEKKRKSCGYLTTSKRRREEEAAKLVGVWRQAEEEKKMVVVVGEGWTLKRRRKWWWRKTRKRRQWKKKKRKRDEDSRGKRQRKRRSR